MSPKSQKVPRPTKGSEFELHFASAQAAKGWSDLCATTRNAAAEAWDFLTRSPRNQTPLNTPMRGELGTVVRDGKTHVRWQLKPTAKGDARIWYYVVDQRVYLEQVHTKHPNQTK